MTTAAPDPDAVIAATRRWLERAVIGLNLCPFARAPYVQGRIRFVVSGATDEETLLADLSAAFDHLHATDPAACETTLLIHPQVLRDFLDYNDFLGRADEQLVAQGLEGIFQVASFHPQYQFAGTAAGDIENASNRSPYPMLHLLREASVTQAVDAVPDIDAIPGRNIETLRKLGRAGWRKLMQDETPPIKP